MEESMDESSDELIDESNSNPSIDQSISTSEAGNIRKKKLIYSKLLHELITECTTTKEKLDMYYVHLHFYHSTVQTSVIVITTASTFIQSLLDSDSDIIPIITLCTSTYSSLVLSLSKFFKLDEKKEQVHNLRERFAELHNKIKYNIDVLVPWGHSEYYDNTEKKRLEWDTIINKVEVDYISIIETKNSLFMEFEKIIDSLTIGKYNNKYDKREVKGSHLIYI